MAAQSSSHHNYINPSGRHNCRATDYRTAPEYDSTWSATDRLCVDIGNFLWHKSAMVRDYWVANSTVFDVDARNHYAARHRKQGIRQAIWRDHVFPLQQIWRFARQPKQQAQ